MKKGFSIVVAFLVLVTLAACAQAPAYTVRVEAGDFDRQHTFASFSIPEAVEGAAFQLRSEEDDVLTPLQIDPDDNSLYLVAAILELIGFQKSDSTL